MANSEFAWSESKDQQAILAEYKDHGDWARHYSTVRMTVGTFFVTASTALIYARWGNPSSSLIAITASLFGIGVLVFGYFTYLTFDRMKAQLKRRELWKPARAAGVDLVATLTAATTALNGVKDALKSGADNTAVASAAAEVAKVTAALTQVATPPAAGGKADSWQLRWYLTPSGLPLILVIGAAFWFLECQFQQSQPPASTIKVEVPAPWAH